MNDNNPLDALTGEIVIRASGLLSLLMPKASGAGIGIKGLDGRYRMANQAMAALFGKDAGLIEGMSDGELFPADVATRLQRSDQQIVHGAAVTSDELDFEIGGAPLRCLWLKFPIHGPDGQVLFIAAVMLHIFLEDAIGEMRQSLEELQKTNLELQNSIAALDRLASTDKLTGAWNRRRLEEAVASEMDRLKRYDQAVSLLVIDIDYFKKVNDEHGHAVGDQVLERLAAVVKSTLRPSDSLTRWGGEEFIVLSPNTTLSTGRMLAERLRDKVGKAGFPTVEHITVSIGVAECLPGETWEEWFKRADAALYRAKAGGRNRVQTAIDSPRRIGAEAGVDSKLVRLEWRPAYECGDALIDAQHRALFDDANKLLAAMLSAHPPDEVSMLIEVLIRDIVQHYQDEEAILTTIGFPDAARHAAMHRQLVDSAVALAGRFRAGSVAVGEVFQFLAHDAVARHMLGADREFFPYLQPGQ